MKHALATSAASRTSATQQRWRLWLRDDRRDRDWPAAAAARMATTTKRKESGGERNEAQRRS